MELWPGDGKTFEDKLEGILLRIIENKPICEYFYQ